MSDDNKFFRLVWRFNALLLLAVIGAVLVLVIGRAVKPDFDPLHLAPPSTAKLLEAFRKAQSGDTYTLDAIRNDADQKSPERLYALSKPFDVMGYDPADPITGPQTANILILDAKTKSSRWLFDGNKRAILSNAMLYQAGVAKADTDAETGGGVIGLVMVIADADTNHDGKLSAHDRQSLYVYRLDGKPAVKLLTADRIFVSQQTYLAGQYQLFYQNGHDTFAVTYAMPDFRLIAKIAIMNVPKLTNAFGPSTSTESIIVTGMRAIAD